MINNNPNFKSWFGRSKVVDAQNRPMVIFHGTKSAPLAFKHKRIGHGSTVLGNYEIERYGIFAAEDPKLAHEYVTAGDYPREELIGHSIMPLYMKIENPLDTLDGVYSETLFKDIEKWGDNHKELFINPDDHNGYRLARMLGDRWGRGKLWTLFDKDEGNDPEIWIKMFKDLGFDGLRIYDRSEDAGNGVWVAFDPTQVKSAAGNTGEFSITDPNLIKESSRIKITPIQDTNVWYHGSPSGDLRGGVTGLHLGTYKAAKEALEARIGVPVEGEWDGTREYGKTLLCGRKTFNNRKMLRTGFNWGIISDEDFFPTKPPEEAPYLRLTMKPAIKAYKLLCPIVSKKPWTDNYANIYMAHFLEKGINKSFGLLYRNDGEDAGNISLVVPNGNCVEEIKSNILKEEMTPEKEQLLKQYLPLLTPDNIILTVQKTIEVPASNFVQIDGILNGQNVFSCNAEDMIKVGYQIPTTQEILQKLPAGKYKLSDLRGRLEEQSSKLDERLSFADLYDDTDDERIFKSKLAGMRVRPMEISMESGNETWNFGYTSQEKSQYKRHGGKVSHRGRIIFFKDSVKPEDSAQDLECMVDCDCKDFQYRFAYVNAQDDASMIGPKSLNKAINRPPIKTNPEGHQQLCKHLAALVRYLTTNIDRARRRSHLRRRPMNIFEALNDITKKGRDKWHYYDEDKSLNEDVERTGKDPRKEKSQMPINWNAPDVQTNGSWNENSIREFAGLPPTFTAIYRAIIDVSDLYPKVEEDPEEYDWSEFRIRRNGFPPIVVMRDENNKLHVMDGNHRVKYAEEIGYRTIGAWVIDKFVQKHLNSQSQSLQETRIINPEHSLSDGYITLYHGTIWPIALKSKKGELGPQDMQKLIMDVLVDVFHESPQSAKEYYDKFVGTRRKDPPLLFLTTSRKGAEGYARSNTKWGGELFYDVISGYMCSKNKKIDRQILAKKLKTDEPAIVTVNVPLEMVLTHPNWSTPLRNRILQIIRNIHSQSELKHIFDGDLNMEVFVKDKIPSRFVQRIDKVDTMDQK